MTITVGNASPTCPPDPGLTTAEDTALALAPGCTDLNGDALTYTFSAQHGTVSGGSYAPNANFNGADTIAYTVSDGINAPVAGTTTITVTPVNDAPVAADDAGIVNVLANDSDVDGDALSAELVGAPAHGKVTLNPNGTFVYTPAVGFSGVDSFTYRAHDAAAASNPATVTLVVAAARGDVKPVTATNVKVSKLAAASKGKALTFTLSAPAKVTIKLVRGKKTVKTYTVAKAKSGKNTLKFKKHAFKRGKYTVKVSVTGGHGHQDAHAGRLADLQLPARRRALAPAGGQLVAAELEGLALARAGRSGDRDRHRRVVGELGLLEVLDRVDLALLGLVGLLLVRAAAALAGEQHLRCRRGRRARRAR